MLRLGSLGIDPPILLAPMAAVTDPPFRTLCEELGCGLTLTEFLPANAVVRGVERYVRKMTATGSGRPFGVQVFGRVPEELAAAARAAAAAGASLVDINMGCPARRVTAGECGSALMRLPDLAAELVRAVREAVPRRLAVTVKIRAGWDDSHRNAPEFAARMVDAGAEMVTVHGRTRSQGFRGQADRRIIAEVKRAVPVPVLANGDIVDGASLLRALGETGADGAMIGRGAIGNPWIFSRLAEVWRGRADPGPPPPAERLATLRRHYQLAIAFAAGGVPAGADAARATRRAVVEMRRQLGAYTRGLPRSAEFRDRAQRIEDAGEVRAAIDGYLHDLGGSDPPVAYAPGGAPAAPCSLEAAA